jgi:peptide/nickel transport system substrate-binding protein
LIDKEKIIKYFKNGLGVAGDYGFTPPFLHTYERKLSGYDVDKALGYLSKVPKPYPIIKLYTTATYLDICLFIQNELKLHGITLTIENVTPSLLSEMRSQGKISFFRGSWLADYQDAESYLSVFSSSNIPKPNYVHYSNTFYDNLLEKLKNPLFDKDKKDIIQQMEQILADECPFIVLYYDISLSLSHKNVVNLKNNLFNIPLLEEVDKI